MGLQSYPGVLTPSECYDAIHAGADALKLFPANVIGTSGVKAYKAILPPEIPLYMVGDVEPDNFAQWFQTGADGFGLGSSLYSSGKSVNEVITVAQAAVAAFDQLTS